MNIRRKHLGIISVVIILSARLPSSLDASAQEFRMPTIAEIVASDPARIVKLHVDLQSIFRGQGVEQLLDDFELKVTGLEFKHVGSGGGGLGVPKYDSFSEYYRVADIRYVSRLAALAGIAPKDLPPCEIEDNVASVTDTHGVPASKVREAACGLRIHKLTLMGPAISALDFISSIDPSEASVRLMPSEYDMIRFLWYRRADARTPEMLEQIRAQFPEFDPIDFP